jgi:hypothetical protein
MPEQDFAADFAYCKEAVMKQLKTSPVRSHSVLTAFLLQKPGYG